MDFHFTTVVLIACASWQLLRLFLFSLLIPSSHTTQVLEGLISCPQSRKEAERIAGCRQDSLGRCKAEL